MLSQAGWTLIVCQCMRLCGICMRVYVWVKSDCLSYVKINPSPDVEKIHFERIKLSWRSSPSPVPNADNPKTGCSRQVCNQSCGSTHWFWKLWPTSGPQCQWVSFNPTASLITSGSSSRETPSSSLCLVRKRTALTLFFKDWHSDVNRHEMPLSQRREIFSTGAF